MGAYELKKRILSYGYTCEIIDWFTHWSHRDLKLIINKFFAGTENPVIAISTPFDHKDLNAIEDVLIWAKNKFTNLKIIHGGARTFNRDYQSLADVFFLGRSMQMFDDWLSKKDLSKYTINTNPLVLVNHNFNQNVDNPVLPIIQDSDCLTKNDILGFEVGVGCKFNCTFCNYELRNVKITQLIDPYYLKQYFDMAYNKYGVTEYFTSDDTINETDEKLEIIAEAMSGLNFKPRITSFARLDLITSRKAQQKLLKQIQFRALYFGIESFNADASKTIRKKTGLGNIYETLEYIRDNCPDTFTVGSLIIGLNKDNLNSIKSSLDKVVAEKLLTSVQIYALNIANAHNATDSYYLSDLDKNPEKFGYKIPNYSSSNKDLFIHDLHWESDWTNHKEALQMVDDLISIYNKKILIMNHFEWTGFYAMGLIKNKNPITKEILKSRAYSISTQLKQNYINQKLNYFGLKGTIAQLVEQSVDNA